MTIEKILFGLESKKENLLKAIKEINQHFGFLSKQAIKLVAQHFGIKEAEVYSTASFYDQIKTRESAKVVIQICDSANCQIKGAEKIIQAVENFLRQKVDDDNNLKFKIERTSCLGRCLQGPIVVINGTVYEKMDPGRIIEILGQYI